MNLRERLTMLDTVTIKLLYCRVNSNRRIWSKAGFQENHFYHLTSNHRFHIRPKYKTLLRISSLSLFHMHINKLFLFYLAAITSLKRKSQILLFRFTRQYTSNRDAYPTRVSGAKRVAFCTFIIEQFVVFFIRVAGIPWKIKRGSLFVGSESGCWPT